MVNKSMAHAYSESFICFVMGEGIGLDALSREVIQKLMRVAQFRELWADLAKQSQNLEGNLGESEATKGRSDWTKMTRRGRSAGPSNSDPRGFVAPNVQFHQNRHKTATNPPNLAGKFIADGLQQLVQAICMAVDAFRHGTQLARFEDQLSSTRQSVDSVALYMAHIRLERFCASDDLHVGKFGLAARQISNLLRAFTQRVSSTYSVERCSFLADALFRLLTKFYECIRWHQRQSANANDTNKFGKAIQKFGHFVCHALRKMLTMKHLKTQRLADVHCQRLFSVCPPSGNERLLTPGALSLARVALPVLLDGQIVRIQKRQRGFLLSPELAFNRRRVAVAHSSDNWGNERTKIAKKDASSDNKRVKISRDSLRSAGPAEIAALREMCKLTLEYIEEVTGNRNDSAIHT
uniref:Uncharacterized protein n=1 Tax=Globodera rostochiensis TaxID=31243 RepID=A0A914GR38_GLORO